MEKIRAMRMSIGSSSSGGSRQLSNRILESAGAAVTIVKEGWVEKRGEHVKNWRRRYFVLYSDGALRGYKEKPQSPTTPLNIFHVKDSQVLSLNEERRFAFTLRANRQKGAFERRFRAESEAERDEWVRLIRQIAMELESEELHGADAETDTDAVDALELCTQLHDVHLNAPVPKKNRLDDFQCLRVLGEGNYGKVLLCRERATKELYALKLLKKQHVINMQQVEHTMAENRVLRHCVHPFLISMKCAFRTAQRLCFVLEYAHGGELYVHLRDARFFPEERARFYAAEIICALGYLHSKNIVYRDIKLENMMLDRHGHIKMADFGLCKDGVNADSKTHTFCGTPEYLAPEIIHKEPYTCSVDWWSLGIIIYEMMTGSPPFRSNNTNVMYYMIIETEVKYPPSMTYGAKSLISGLLTKNTRERLGSGHNGTDNIKAHMFFYGLNWNDLEAKKIQPPFVPFIASEEDTQYFDKEFTSQDAQLTPPESDGPLMEDDALFERFSFSKDDDDDVKGKLP